MGDYETLYSCDKLIPLHIGEVECQVPENNSLLRCFQYLQIHMIAMGGFCWNADCQTCEVTVRHAGAERKVLSCQTLVEPGMQVVGMTEKLKFCLRALAKKP